MEHRELPADQISISIDVNEIEELQKTIELPDVIGQPRALRALQIGTEIRARGYNIFVTGQSGTGRTTSIKKVLSHYQSKDVPLVDTLFVYNFTKPDYPQVLYLPQGEGKTFKHAVHQLVEDMKSLIRKKLDSDAYKQERDRLIGMIDQEENRALTDFEEKLLTENFKLVHIHEEDSESTDIVPLYNGEAVDFEKLQQLVKAGKIDNAYWNRTRERYYQLMDEMRRLFQELKEGRSALEKELESLQIETVTPGVEEEVERLQEHYTEPSVSAYLEALKNDIVHHLFLFLREQPSDEGGNPALVRYGVNVMVDNSTAEQVPVIFEHHPTTSNLFGAIESRLDLNGQSRSTFMMIKAGSLIRASGGFLVLNAQDILRDEDLWDQLKRVLQTEQVEIQPSEHVVSFQYTMMKPQPIKIDTKVIVVGSENLYDNLYNQDTDFHKHFKISAEFDSVMPLSQDNLARYIGFIKMIQDDERLLPFESRGIARIVEHGILLAEQRDKISTQFSLIADLLRESSYWAAKMGHSQVGHEAVEKALYERKYLAGLPEEKLVEMISTGEIQMKFSGAQTGIINGLAIHDRGYYSFGLPTVVSARVAPGNEGIINIEREVGLSGEIHDKWVLILEGYLRNKYAHSFPLSMYASLCFEQSYSEIDGDSASAAEIYALLSAVAETPFDQGIAVTGSVNQMGEIMPVGGISEKLEGFFTMCKLFGLSGSQGVLIPKKNTHNVMVNTEVREAIEQGKFHIYPINTIDEGLEILTGMVSGARSARGVFPKDSINAHIEHRLKEMANQVKNYSG